MGYRANGPAFDKFSLGEDLAKILFALADVVDPVDDTTDDGAMIPTHVCY